WVYDHAKISDAMKPLMKLLDHAYLNDIEGLENPTIEKMAEWFWKKLESQCPGLCEIVVHETATARCAYRGKYEGVTAEAAILEAIQCFGARTVPVSIAILFRRVDILM